MKIACLGWGSLIWDPGKLLTRGEWKKDGPKIPLEYKRQSNDGRLTLVIDPDSEPLTTLWILMGTDDLAQAKESLRSREKTNVINIGNALSGEISSDPIRLAIINWAKEQNLDAVIWTNLAVKFSGQAVGPTLEEAIAYLDTINDEKLEKAKEYIIKTPLQINTVFRKRFAAKYGWADLSTI